MATTTIVEHCQIAPCEPTDELLLPLIFCDVVFFPLPPREHLTFYSFQCSESHFSDTIVPNLKKSLSLTLNHFSPLAGKIIFPLTSSGNMPVSHYESGDSISLTIAVSKADLIPLTGNHPRDTDQFHDFVPDLPPATHSSDSIKFSVAAIQVTLFPNQGICIGVAHHHAIADGSTFVRFLQAWASITKNDTDSHLLAASSADDKKCLSSHDRSRFEEEENIKTLTRACWDLVRARGPPTVSSAGYLPTRKTRATFVLSRDEIQKLKNFVVDKKPSIMTSNVSSFTVVCAHVWTSLAKAAAVDDDDDDDELENFNCAADCRRRLDPPMPDNYFGNCLALVMAKSTRGELKGDQGIVIAAEAISEAIHKTVTNEKGILDGFMERVSELGSLMKSGVRRVGTSGSPRFDVYGVDFGWGKPKKFEFVHNYYSGAVSLCMSREFEGGVEIGLSMSKIEMDAFGAIFNQGLKEAGQVNI